MSQKEPGMIVQFDMTPEVARNHARLFFTLHGGSARYGKHVRIGTGSGTGWSTVRALTARGKAFLRTMTGMFVWLPYSRTRGQTAGEFACQGDGVYVKSGPYTSSTGRVDFIDERGQRALVNFGGGRHGGLRWVAREHLFVQYPGPRSARP